MTLSLYKIIVLKFVATKQVFNIVRDNMDSILELIFAFISLGIYGTEDRPRHPIWRNIVRAIAFGGAFAAAAIMLFGLGEPNIPLFVELIWLSCMTIILMAEYYVGSKRVAFAAIVVFALLLILVFATQDIF